MVAKPAFRLLILCSLGLVPGHVARADEPLASRRERIEDMNLVQKEHLLQLHKQFQTFKPQERERLRNLHHDIEKDPGCDELRRVMDRYYDWLKTLSSYQLMELRKLSPEERIQRIKTLQQEKHDPGRGRGRPGYGRFDRYGKTAEQVNPSDRKALLDWTARYAARYEDTFTQSLPDPVREKLQQELGRIGDSRDRMQVLFWRMWLRRQLDDPDKPLPDIDDDWPRLLAALSPQTLEAQAALPEREQRAKIAIKIRSLALEHYFTHRASSVPSVISDKELAGFFTKNLDQGRRSWLLGLPSADMRRAVWKLYLLSKLPGMPQGFPSMGPGGSRRPGSQRYGPPQRGEGKRPNLGRPAPPPGGPMGPDAPPRRQPVPPSRNDKAAHGKLDSGTRSHLNSQELSP